MKSAELQRCARVAIEFCGHTRRGERVLIVTDTMRDPSVAEALMGAALAAGAEPVLTIMPNSALHTAGAPACCERRDGASRHRLPLHDLLTDSLLRQS